MRVIPDSLLGRVAAGAILFGSTAILVAIALIAVDRFSASGNGSISVSSAGESSSGLWGEVVSGFVGFGSALVVAALAFVTMRYQMRHQWATEARRHRLSKLEELHETLSQIDNFYRDLLAEFAWLLDESPLPIESPDAVERVPIPRMLMLADIYAGEAKAELHRVDDIKRKMQTLLLDAYTARGRSRADRAKVYDRVGGAIATMMIEVDKARKAVTRVAQQVANEP